MPELPLTQDEFDDLANLADVGDGELWEFLDLDMVRRIVAALTDALKAKELAEEARVALEAECAKLRLCAECDFTPNDWSCVWERSRGACTSRTRMEGERQ
jgi:hypothetical protein